MNKISLFIFTIMLLLIGLVGCSSTETTIKQEDQVEMDAQNILSIRLMEDDQPSVYITELPSLDRFVQAITTAEYDEEQLDIAARDYGTTVIMKDDTSYDFSFWIAGSSTGLFTKSGHNGHYRLLETSNKDLSDLFHSATKKDLIPTSNVNNPQPPSVQVTVGGEQFKAIQGSYCWKTENTGQCVDKASYDELVTKQKIQPTAVSGDPVELEFSSVPETLSVMASFPGDERPNEALSVHNGRFYLAAGSGRHVYIIDARWPQGSASYVFEVECTVR